MSDITEKVKHNDDGTVKSIFGWKKGNTSTEGNADWRIDTQKNYHGHTEMGRHTKHIDTRNLPRIDKD